MKTRLARVSCVLRRTAPVDRLNLGATARSREARKVRSKPVFHVCVCRRCHGGPEERLLGALGDAPVHGVQPDERHGHGEGCALLPAIDAGTHHTTGGASLSLLPFDESSFSNCESRYSTSLLHSGVDYGPVGSVGGDDGVQHLGRHVLGAVSGFGRAAPGGDAAVRLRLPRALAHIERRRVLDRGRVLQIQLGTNHVHGTRALQHLGVPPRRLYVPQARVQQGVDPLPRARTPRDFKLSLF